MISRLVTSVSAALDFNLATLSGCIDIIVVPDERGRLRSTPFHVRFGKIKLLRSREKLVSIAINGQTVPVRMVLGSAGEAYFVCSADEEEEATSPEPASVGPPPTAPQRGMLARRADSSFRAPDIQLSLCGHLLLGLPEEAQHDHDVFQANLLDESAFDNDGTLWFNPSLVFRFGQNGPCFPARTSLPLIASWAIFGKSLSKQAFVQLVRSRLRLKDSAILFDQIAINMNEVLHPAEEPIQTVHGVQPSSPIAIAFSRMQTGTTGTPDTRASRQRCNSDERLPADTIATIADRPAMLPKLLSINSFFSCCGDGAVQQEHLAPNELSEPEQASLLGRNKMSMTSPVPKVQRRLKPSSAQLELMNLKPGSNSIVFTVTSSLLGTKSVKGSIYLWPRDCKIIVSDVDGTITKSDLWGQVAPIIGTDWSHPGVADLFSRIARHNYKIVYLTARAIGQADTTRDYLFGLTQHNSRYMPDGPLILSPDRLFPSFKREVIDRKPFVFKIAALRDLRSLFPSYYNPFYAGFGNRDTDHRAYVHVGIPEARIFIIDPTGHVHHVNDTYAKSYPSMSTMADKIFPNQSLLNSRLLPYDETNDSEARKNKVFAQAKPAAIEPNYALTTHLEANRNPVLPSPGPLLPASRLRFAARAHNS